MIESASKSPISPEIKKVTISCMNPSKAAAVPLPSLNGESAWAEVIGNKIPIASNDRYSIAISRATETFSAAIRIWREHTTSSTMVAVNKSVELLILLISLGVI